MTTAWAHATQGRLGDALRAHAAGTLLAVVALVAGVGALIVATRGKRLAWQPGETTLAGVAVVLTGLILCEWIVRLWMS